jgi:hypothetical protein
MSNFRRYWIALAAFPLIPACGDDEPSGPATSFSAVLSGEEEFPPVATTATGTATFDIVGDQINYTVNVVGLSNAVVSHIHVAPEGVNGPVRMDLCGTGAPLPACTSGTAVLATGSNGTTVGSPAITFDQLVEEMRAGNTYVNVHTNDGVGQPNTGAGDMQSGEIRGQIVAD